MSNKQPAYDTHYTIFPFTLPIWNRKKINIPYFCNKMNGTIYGKQKKRGGEIYIQKGDCRSRIYLALKIATLGRSHWSSLMTGKCNKPGVSCFTYSASARTLR